MRVLSPCVKSLFRGWGCKLWLLCKYDPAVLENMWEIVFWRAWVIIWAHSPEARCTVCSAQVIPFPLTWGERVPPEHRVKGLHHYLTAPVPWETNKRTPFPEHSMNTPFLAIIWVEPGRYRLHPGQSVLKTPPSFCLHAYVSSRTLPHMFKCLILTQRCSPCPIGSPIILDSLWILCILIKNIPVFCVLCS